ncbi:hypothetical protein ACLOJK_007304 [Asimina triloba]
MGYERGGYQSVFIGDIQDYGGSSEVIFKAQVVVTCVVIEWLGSVLQIDRMAENDRGLSLGRKLMMMAEFDWCEKAKSGRMNNDGCVRMTGFLPGLTKAKEEMGAFVSNEEGSERRRRWVRLLEMKKKTNGFSAYQCGQSLRSGAIVGEFVKEGAQAVH